jgi:hypothetical protein
MAVVINEMEVAPQAAPGTQPAQSPATAEPKDSKKVEKALARKRHRALRLEAY